MTWSFQREEVLLGIISGSIINLYLQVYYRRKRGKGSNCNFSGGN